MSKISTKNLNKIPEISALQQLCKALATLDAIICREWEYRYYSYNKNWDIEKKEEFLQMRDGSGDEFQILFTPKGAVINGLAHESEMSNWTNENKEIWKGVVDSLPKEFHNFVFGEPVKSIGTTFCIWRKLEDDKWQIGDIVFPESDYGDGSEDLIYILDNQAKTYLEWALEYYEEQFEEYELSLELVQRIYNFEILTKELVLKINPHLDDFEELENDLKEIGYPYRF